MDCKKENVGLINDIPVVIGDGSVIKLNNKELHKSYYHSANNLQIFSMRVNSNHFPELQAKTFNNGMDIVKFFQKNQDYTKYPWGEHDKPEAWAQTKYIEEKGFKKQTADEKYQTKEIIEDEVIESLRNRKDSLSPIAKEFVELILDNNLRKKDVPIVAKNTIESIINKRGKTTKDAISFIEEFKGRNNIANDRSV